MKVPHRLILAIITAASTAATPLHSQGPNRQGAPLMVLLVVDQMRADYVDRFAQDWTGGLHRIFERGAVYSNAAYPYMNTVTCAGHATVATGAFPLVHGMVLNAWWDRELGKNVTCTEDPRTPLISYGPPVKGGGGPWRLRAPTLADELRYQGRTPRIVTVSLKERSAVTLAGQRATAAVWFDDMAHTWATSSAYTQSPLPFMTDFFKKEPLRNALNYVWTRLLSPNRYPTPDDAEDEQPPTGWTRTFPHPIDDGSHKLNRDFYERWSASPASDAYLASTARTAIDALGLGSGPGVDYLAISFSALDLVGHDFGPRSQEIQDLLAHLDRTIGDLLTFLDERVGRNRYVVALTADHGVSEIPEQVAREGRDAGRVMTREIVARVEKALEPIVGRGPHVGRMNFTDLYLVPQRAAEILNNPAAFEAARQAMLSVPGVMQVFSSAELSHRGNDGWQIAAGLSYFPGRSGDLIVIPKPNWILVNSQTNIPPSAPAATHGTGHPYDQRVPLVLLGAGIKSGTYTRASTPADIAPTLAYLAGISMPHASGRILREAIAQDSP